MECFPSVWAPIQLSYFTAIVSILLVIFVSVGNVLIIIAVITDPTHKLRTPFNYFLVNLAASDFIVGAITMPISVAIHFQETTGWINPTFIKVLHLSYFISATMSVLSLSALSVDRFCAIKWPIQYRAGLNLRRCGVISVALWIVSISVSMLYLKTGYVDYLMVFSHFAVLLTFLILIATYVQVYQAFRLQIQEIRNARRPSEAYMYNQLSAIKSEKKVTRAFLWILGFFIACYAPAIIMIYILQFCKQCSCNLRHTLRDLQFLIVTTSSGLNPLICAIRLKAFRTAILLVLGIKPCDKSKKHTFNSPDTLTDTRESEETV